MENFFRYDFYFRNDPEMMLLYQYFAVVSDKWIATEFNGDVLAGILEGTKRLMGEYYYENYGDNVAKQQMRFNDKCVEPKSFNLWTEHNLEMHDKNLNQHVPIRYLAPYCSKTDVS